MNSKIIEVTAFVADNLPKGKNWYNSDYSYDKKFQKFEKSTIQAMKANRHEWESLLVDLEKAGYNIEDFTNPVERGFVVNIKSEENNSLLTTLGISVILPYYCLFHWTEEENDDDITRIQQIAVHLEKNDNHIRDIVKSHFNFPQMDNSCLGYRIEGYSIDNTDPSLAPTVYNVLFSSDSYEFIDE